MNAEDGALETAIISCPATGQRLRRISLQDLESETGEQFEPIRRNDRNLGDKRFESPEIVLANEDGRLAYPIIDGIPVLLAPEAMGPKEDGVWFDVTTSEYQEAYAEMAFYNGVAEAEAVDIKESAAFKIISSATAPDETAVRSFPEPRHIWLDSVFDCAAQHDAYSHLAPIEGKAILQLGGKGAHAVKLALAGARIAIAITPMFGEAICARALAKAAGVQDRVFCIVGVAEALPFQDAKLDAVYSGGCLHHTVTDLALPEVERVLKSGGRFAAVDMWDAPLYRFGTGLLGKREVGVQCQPLDAARVAPLASSFSKSEVLQHGTLTRYPLLALEKFGLSSSLETVWKLNSMDDWICSRLPKMRSFGSSVVTKGTKSCAA